MKKNAKFLMIMGVICAVGYFIMPYFTEEKDEEQITAIISIMEDMIPVLENEMIDGKFTLAKMKIEKAHGELLNIDVSDDVLPLWLMADTFLDEIWKASDAGQKGDFDLATMHIENGTDEVSDMVDFLEDW